MSVLAHINNSFPHSYDELLEPIDEAGVLV